MPPKKNNNNFPKPAQPAPSTHEIIITAADREAAFEHIKQTGDGKVGTSIMNMIRSRFKVLYITSSEEKRVIEFFKNVAIFRGVDLFRWDFDRGLLDARTKEKVVSASSEIYEGNAVAAIAHIVDHASKHNKVIQLKQPVKGAIYLLLDFHTFLSLPPVQRKIKEFSELISGCTIVVVAPNYTCPDTLEKEVTLIDFPVPSYDEIKVSLQNLAKEISMKLPQASKEAKEKEEDLIKAASGLTLSEAENAYAMSLVSENRFDIQRILDEKKQMIRKGGILEYKDSRFKLDDLGGLDTLKEWVKLRRLAFKEDARAFGISAPKGLLMIGIPGTGKSATCDAIAHEYNMPLLRLDFGAVFSAHIGESENNIRRCLKTAEAIAPCILWIDEVEKGIGGVESSNATDGGVTNRVFGTMLTWMQDKLAPVFVVCTANSIRGIPPEFMRAGRFDEVFFIDLPNEEQRVDIITKLLKKKHRNPDLFNISQIAECSENYTPVEIEKGIENALFVAFSENKRQVTADDIVSSIKSFAPLYNSRREEIAVLREWAIGKNGIGGRAVLANSLASTNLDTGSDSSDPSPTGFNLDL